MLPETNPFEVGLYIYHFIHEHLNSCHHSRRGSGISRAVATSWRHTYQPI